MIKKAEAIASLKPEAEFVMRGEELEWLSPDIDIPSDDEIDAEMKRLETEYDSQAYARKRAAEYPSIQECVHAILDDDLDALQTKRAEIKKKYPKG